MNEYKNKGTNNTNVVGAVSNGTKDDYYGDSGKINIIDIPYNSSAVYDSPAGQSLRKVSYSTVTEGEYEGLRRQATFKCLNPNAKRNPCNPTSKQAMFSHFFSLMHSERKILRNQLPMHN